MPMIEDVKRRTRTSPDELGAFADSASRLLTSEYNDCIRGNRLIAPVEEVADWLQRGRIDNEGEECDGDRDQQEDGTTN